MRDGGVVLAERRSSRGGERMTPGGGEGGK